MTHDIAHCNNESCPAKDRCRRFQAHLHAIASGEQYCSYLMLTEQTKESVQRLGSCIHFWERNE